MTTIVRQMRAVPPGILPVIAIDRDSGKPLYRQLYEGYRDAIAERRLRGGQRLPSTRSLAAELRISRIPVLNAFEQLLAEGYFESRVGSGTFVARSLPGGLLEHARRSPLRAAPTRRAPRPIARAAAKLLDEEPGRWFKGRGAFNVGDPALDRFPIEIWSNLVARHCRRADRALLPYANPMGLPALREAVAEYLRTARAVRCEADQIMIVNGSQQALELAARVLFEPDTSIWVEDPGYFGIHAVLRLSGARLVPVPVDEQGMDVAAGIARCPDPRAAFVTPSHQFPLGVTMSAGRRLQLLDFAREHGCWIVEDDYDSEYRYGNLPIAALQGLDRDSRVIYVGTFTKILFPALRLAYVVLPADLADPSVDGSFLADLPSGGAGRLHPGRALRAPHPKDARAVPRAPERPRRGARERSSGRDPRARRRSRDVSDGGPARRLGRCRDRGARGGPGGLGGAALRFLPGPQAAAGVDPRIRVHEHGSDRSRCRGSPRRHPGGGRRPRASRPALRGQVRGMFSRNRRAPSRSPTISQTRAAVS